MERLVRIMNIKEKTQEKEKFLQAAPFTSSPRFIQHQMLGQDNDSK